MHLSTSGSECGNQRDFLCPSCLNFLIKTDCWVYNYFMSVIDVTVYRKCFRLLSRLQPCQIYLHITSLPPAVDDTNPNVLGTFEFPAYAVFIPFYRHQLERFILLYKTCTRFERGSFYTYTWSRVYYSYNPVLRIIICNSTRHSNSHLLVLNVWLAVR